MGDDPSSAGGASDDWLAHTLSHSREFAVIRMTLDGTIDGWSGAAGRLFGYRLTEIRGQHFEVLFTEGDRELGIPRLELDVALKTPRSEDDRWHVHKDGGRFWASGVVTKLHNPDGTLAGFVKVLRDRTDLRIRYLTLQHRVDTLNRELAERNEAMLTLLHELRNPLSPLSSAAQIFQSDVSAEMRSKTAKVVARQVELMSRLLADAARTAAAAPPTLHLQPIVLQEALKVVVDGLEADAAAKPLTLQLVISPEPVVLQADPDRLHQMVLNLVLNAMKYTPAKGHVTVSATVEGDLAAIRVEDDGIGIDKANLDRIFELFVREEAVRDVEGFGVGLAVVKRLATLHGGFLEARSPGRGLGSRFTLQLPLRRSA
jgi:two-component system CheB/CheR fusion protein